MNIESKARSIPDSDVMQYDDLQVLMCQLEEAKDLHANAVANLVALKDRQAAIAREAQAARDEISRIDKARPERLAELLMARQAFSEDDELLARRSNLEAFMARVELAAPAIERRIKEAHVGVRVAVDPVQTLEEKIDRRRMEIKREIARNQG